MAITVKHKFVSAIPDAGDPTIVQPSNWNDDHQLTGTVPVANGGTGVATLTGYVKGSGTANLTASTTIPNTDITGLGTASTKDAGVALGVATLDGSGTVPISQLPSAVLGALSYQGTWDASSNTPTLTSSVGTKGYYYVVNVAGSTNLNGITDWKVGDWAVYNGTAWQKVDNTDQVSSVNGYTGTVVLGYGDITTGVVPVANGGTGVTTSSGANSVVLRDANGNITTNCLFEGYVTQAASGTTIVLTASTAQNYQITGSGGQTIKLPSATTLPSGATFTFNNNQSSGVITVQNNSSTTIATINSGGYVTVVLLDNSTAAGSWDRHDSTPSNVSWSTNTLDYPGSITSASWNGATVTVSRGGTGATTLTGYVKGSGTSALTANATIPTTDLSGTITNAQLANSAITINGTSTSLGGSISVGTVTSVTATAPVASTGGTTPVISMPVATSSVNGYLSSTDWTTFNNKSNTNGTVTNVSALTLGTSGTDLSSTVATSTTTPVITLNVPTASATNRGVLSSTDWTTFNNKGSVSSVAATVPSFLSITGSPITSSGTLAITYSGTALPVANGGTGLTASGTAGNVLTSNGTTWVSQAPSTATASYARTSITATVGQTTFSVTYVAPYIQVFQNGTMLNASDYTATNGTTVVLAIGASTGDILEFIAYNGTSIAVAGGSNTQVQYNSSGSLAGNSGFTFTGNDLNIPFGTSNSATSSAKIALALSMIA